MGQIKDSFRKHLFLEFMEDFNLKVFACFLSKKVIILKLLMNIISIRNS